jgi:WD40 repeat protein
MGRSRTKIGNRWSRWSCTFFEGFVQIMSDPQLSCIQVRLWDPKTGKSIGDAMKGHTKWVTSLAWEPIHMCVRHHSHVRLAYPHCFTRNANAPRLASSSKDGTVRVWSTLTRQLEYALGGHAASVNVVRWGGGGNGGKGVLYTASSDRTVRVWDSNGVSGHISTLFSSYLMTIAGKTPAHSQRPRPLGHNSHPQHRLRPAHRSL